MPVSKYYFTLPDVLKTFLFLLTPFFGNDSISQSLVNSTGNTIANNTFNVEYSIGEIGITTLATNQNHITQGLLQPPVQFKDCSLLKLIPSGFTPNHDNINDEFGAKNWPSVSNYGLQVFNRWGQVVFETSNVHESWNGDYKGVAQPMGAYVYKIKAITTNCGVISTTGTVILIR